MPSAAPASSLPAQGAYPVTPSNTVSLAVGGCRALYVGTSGDITGLMLDGNVATFKGVPVGILPVGFTRVNATGTTAADMLALY